MRFDVRWPVGAFFTLLGMLLALYGGVVGARVAPGSSGINVDLWWGIVLGMFGIGALIGAARSRRSSSDR